MKPLFQEGSFKLKVLSFIGSWIGIAGFVWVLFERADKVMKQDAKEKISIFLINFDFKKKINTFPEYFISIFDSIFGDKHFSIKCIMRSCFSSLLSLLLICLFQISISEIPEYDKEAYIILPIYIFFLGILINFIPDYISLLETRYLISLVSKKKPKNIIFILIFFDIFLSTIIIFFGIQLYNSLKYIFHVIPDERTMLWMLIFNLGSLPESYFECLTYLLSFDSVYSLFFYSTFFTSVWLWVYSISVFIAPPLAKICSKWYWLLNNFFDIANKPILSLGWISSMIVTLIFALLTPFVIF
jgi:hypothetical protein